MSSASSVTRNASCPTQNTLSLPINSLVNRKYSSSPNTLHSLTNSTHKKPLQQRTILQRIKTGVVQFIKSISKDNHQTKSMDCEQQSTFLYDPELDLSEEHLSLLSKFLLTTLRESKIKHLSCDNLFLPCNHLRNIARQCLIMSAEEPFGIMGAQIKIRLLLDKSNVVKYLPVIRLNSKQKATFEIEIDLHEDTKMFTFRRFLSGWKIFKELKEKSSLYVSSRCVLVKNVFYKTAQPKRAVLDS